MHRFTLKLCIILLVAYFVDTARILFVSPLRAYSHQLFYRPILYELLNRGHEVVHLTPRPINDTTLKNLTEINLEWNEQPVPNHGLLDVYTENQFYFLLYLKHEIGISLENAFQNPSLRDLIANRSKYKFDIVVMEWIAVIFVSFSEIFKCPVIGLQSISNSFLLDLDMGLPMPMLQSFDTLYPFSHPSKSFYDRMNLVLTQWQYYAMKQESVEWEKDYAEKYFGIKRSEYERIRGKMKLILVNQHPAFTGSVIQSLGVVNIGGLLYKPAKPLPKNLQDFLDNASEGVIYLSFGTNVQSYSIRKEMLRVLTEVLKDLPYKVLWKWDGDKSDFENYKNILIQKWFPQYDVLQHPNVKCFITQAGLLSVEEAIHGHVPMIPIPFFSDQHYIAHRIHELKIGIYERLTSLTVDGLRNSILTVVNDPMYKKNIKKLATLYHDQITPPLDKAVWWIEHAIRHNGCGYLENPLREYSVFELYMLDIFATILLCIIFIIIVTFYVLKFTVAVCKRKFKLKFD